MVALTNSSELTYALIRGLTDNFTGADFLSIAVIVFGLFLLTVLLRIPIEFSLIYIIPILLVVGVMYSQLLIMLGIVLVMVALIMAKNYFFR